MRTSNFRLIRFTKFSCSMLSVAAVLFLLHQVSSGEKTKEIPRTSYQKKVLNDSPEFYWSMAQSQASTSIQSTGAVPAAAVSVGDKKVRHTAGARPEEYPMFSAGNTGIELKSPQGWLVVKDSAKPSDQKKESSLKYKNGDAITIEAWVNPAASMNVPFPYIVGKGRTQNKGFHADNQNYALRLVKKGNDYLLSFFFVDEDILKSGSATTNGHRWTSKRGLPIDGGWHHVAISYKFGTPESIVGYIDGKASNGGTWDLAGATKKNPVVDDDELWIGASMDGGNHFQGGIDELAIYRKIIPVKTLAARFKRNQVDYLQNLVDQTLKIAPSNHVAIDVHEGTAAKRNWNFRPAPKETIFKTPAFAITKLPLKYNARGIIVDRTAPLVVHAYSKVSLPAGEQEIVVRALNSTRLYIDGKLHTETPFMGLGGSAHGTMHKLETPKEGQLSLAAAHSEKRFLYKSDGKPHVFSMITIAGEASRQPILGEIAIAYGQPGKTYQLLGYQPEWTFNDQGWLAFLKADEIYRNAWNKTQRQLVSQDEIRYWKQRHEAASILVKSEPQVPVPAANSATAGQHPIDRFIAVKLKKQNLNPTGLVDEVTYLRRVTLDLTGLNPTPEQIREFLEDTRKNRREMVVDRLLNLPSFADHAVSYWQDVLAENPGLTKPNLNNSGPFRWYLHDAFSDNRSFDRIVTELILMEGSRFNGGTAGFAVAANNDVPMAAKAHILGTAFLGIEMKCARCHDAPYHQSIQQDLFEVAAMLDRKPVAVPKSSSIVATPEQIAKMPVKVTLKPGTKVSPAWPFKDLVSKDFVFDPSIIRNPKNSREVLAAYVTHPENKRFSKVVVNRVWKQLIGRGIVEPAEDWETGDASHPELLDWLAQEFVRDGYDLKKLNRLIVTSQLYQQKVAENGSDLQKQFAGPSRKRLTAEQIVDSIFQAVGKPLPSERLTYNSDGRQANWNFIDFGNPKRAWELVAISNERERPSMALPKAQSVVDMLSAYGWRSERQDPVTVRELIATPLQPLALANGDLLNRAVDISDHGTMVELALNAETVENFVDEFFLRILARHPSADEKELYTSLLSQGFNDRKTGVTEVTPVTVVRSPLTWTAHFDPDAATEGIRQETAAAQGDLPTKRLNTEWREKAEDALWALFNTPEFMFVP